MNRMRIALAGAVVAVVAGICALPAMAAPPTTATATQTVKFTNRASVQLALSQPIVDFGQVDPLTPYTAAGGTATVKANAPWTLTVAAPANFTESPTGTGTIPIGRLGLSANGGAYNTLVNGTNSVATGAATTNTGTATTLGYQLTLQFGDAPNTTGSNYQAVLTYTASTP